MYQIKNVKSFQGREGLGFECSLYKDGKKIGIVTDTANGGMTDFYLDKGEKELLDKYCETLPPIVFDGRDFEMPASCDTFLSGLVDEWDKQQQIKRWCRTKTVFSLAGDAPGNYRTINSKYCLKVKKHILNKYKDKNPTICNETVAKQLAI